jgi:molecular chaperone GrpE (heat shock protein)
MPSKYAAMTVNERLYVSGFMDEFDKALAVRDVDKIRAILSKVELTEESMKPILEQLGF